MAGTAIFKVVNEATPTEMEGYVCISDVPGITFEVDKSLRDGATAVMEISPNIDFIDYQSYSYKNGEDTYLLFSINKYIVIAQKGTKFKLSEGQENLKNYSLNGIWFTPSGKTVKENNIYKQEVKAQAVITNELYNDFKGTLATIEVGEEEWSLFAGAVDKKYKEYENMIKYTTSTLSSSSVSDKESDMVDIDSNVSEKVGADMTTMLEIGDTGCMKLINSEQKAEEAYIKIMQRYNREQAEEIIKEYIASGDSYYSEMSAPEGTHFEAVEYEVKFGSDINAYVNISLKGLDCSDLKFRGIKYSSKTYDILNKQQLDGEWYKKRICFYAVPDDCEEYSLKCGEESEDNSAIYYWIGKR